MTEIRHRRCPLCEAGCGLTLEIDGDRVTKIRGDSDDPMSRGYLCPKGVALADIHHDPDRIRRPLRKRDDGGWEELSWDAALDLAASRLHQIRAEHGADALAFYQGNPTIHSHTAVLYGLDLRAALGTRYCFSTASIDHLPHMLGSFLLFGHQLLLPVPDIDRTDFLLVLGANPLVSNGSLMTAPRIRERLAAVKERGGTIVVVDPCRTRTAELADLHLAIRPGTDVLLLAALIHTLFAENLVDPGRLEPMLRGRDEVQRAVAELTPERVAPMTGIEPEQCRDLARRLASARSAAVYGRIGVCTQAFGSACAWLILVLDALTGNLDRPGGKMFTTPAFDGVRVATILGQQGSFDTYRTRSGNAPEFSGEVPLATLAEEIENAGIRGFVTAAGNPVLSAPNGRRIEQALRKLDFFVAIDIYVNETTRLADLILPPTFALERDGFDMVQQLTMVRNSAQFAPPIFPRSADARHDWEIYLELARRLHRLDGSMLDALKIRFAHWLGPRAVVDLALRFGPYGSGLNPFGSGMTLKRLEADTHGVDLGPLQPQLPARLCTPDKKIDLAPERLVAELELARRQLDVAPNDGLLLIGRRQLQSNNSWMHNSARLMKERNVCTLQIHPSDASRLGLADGMDAQVRSRVGQIVVPVEITDRMRPGVVSIPHGFGHGRSGNKLTIADAHPGASLNDLTDDTRLDGVTGTAAFSGVPVHVEPAP